MEQNLLTEHVYQDVRKTFESFKSEHGCALSNQVVQSFLHQQSNYQLFTTAICFPTKENWDKLDHAFKQFYIEVRFINYIAKVLWRYARDFRMKHQRNEEHHLFILDQPIYTEGSSTITYKDQLIDNSEDKAAEEESLLNQVEDCYLQEILKQLTDKQLRVLNNYFVQDITQKEIACCLNVSQQSVSKILKTALEKLKDLYNKEKKNSNQ